MKSNFGGNYMIYTVTGPINKEELGVTLEHEHIWWDPQADERMYFDKIYNEERTAELFNRLLPVFLKLYKEGCRAVVETSPPEGGQNVKLLQLLSMASGVKIIPNTGLFFSKYVYRLHGANYEKELAQRWTEDFEKGLDTIGGVVIRPSHIKIFMDGTGLPEVERKLLEAAVIASNATGLPIHCHINKTVSAYQVLEHLKKTDCNFSKFLWAHASFEADREAIKRAAAMGVWLGFDMIKPGTYPLYCSLIKEAIRNGYQDRILLSQDMDFLDEVISKGDNHPCASILTDFIPYCEANGMPKETVLGIMTENPSNFYNI
jgi:phosphotriesterase-related protein